MAGILAVCTGNVCRSPFLEQLLRARLEVSLGPGHGITVASAGIRVAVGAPLDPSTAARLSAEGVPPTPHAARQLSAADVATAALVLAPTREHRAAAVRAHVPALGYALTIADLVRLLPLVDAGALPAEPGERLAPLVRAVAARRGSVAPANSELDDVPDPIGQPGPVYVEVARRLTEAVDLLVDLICFGTPGRRPAVPTVVR